MSFLDRILSYLGLSRKPAAVVLQFPQPLAPSTQVPREPMPGPLARGVTAPAPTATPSPPTDTAASPPTIPATIPPPPQPSSEASTIVDLARNHVPPPVGVPGMQGPAITTPYQTPTAPTVVAPPKAPTPHNAYVPGPGLDVFLQFRAENINGQPDKRDAFMARYGMDSNALNFWIGYWQQHLPHA